MTQAAPAIRRPLWAALWRGWRRTCPACGGALYAGYLKVRSTCGQCGLGLDGHRADDAPPYFTILIIGHLVVPGLLLTEQTWHPPAWVHYSIWLPLTVALALWFLPRVKGALIGLQWAQRMHGFGREPA